jgi:hypothetical protein
MPSAKLRDLPSLTLDLPLLALHGREQAPAGGGAERLRRPAARPVRRRLRGSELAVGVDEDALSRAGERRAADAGEEGGGLVVVADPDRPRLACLTGVRDVDVVVAGGEVAAGARAEPDVAVAGGVRVERPVAEGGVVVAGGVGEEAVVADRDVVVGGGAVGEGAGAEREVLVPRRAVVERVRAGGDVVVAGRASAEERTRGNRAWQPW